MVFFIGFIDAIIGGFMSADLIQILFEHKTAKIVDFVAFKQEKERKEMIHRNHFLVPFEELLTNPVYAEYREGLYLEHNI